MYELRVHDTIDVQQNSLEGLHFELKHSAVKGNSRLREISLNLYLVHAKTLKALYRPQIFALVEGTFTSKETFAEHPSLYYLYSVIT